MILQRYIGVNVAKGWLLVFVVLTAMFGLISFTQELDHIEANYKRLLKDKRYILPRQVTVNDLYAFDPNAKVSIDPFIDIIGRHFKQPKEGLGNDNSAVAHMWRSIARPDSPL